MADFNPSPHDRLVIGGLAYQVMPHPAVPTFAFGQEGRKAFVYQVSGGPDKGLYALKKFKEVFRLPELVEICDQLARFAPWPGLEVCDRLCLHSKKHADAIDRYPDLEYAVLMPWIGGSTWYDMVIGMTPLSRLEALTYANAVAQVLAAIEEAGLAHCDISAANVIVNSNTQRAHLIDVEDLYAPGFSPPASLPAGTDGYAHRTAGSGLWGPYADRFAGAVIVAEMAAWWSPDIRREAEDEHYFSPTEMQEDSSRYRLMRSVLESVEPRLPELFDQAWFSNRLEDCPPLQAWQEALSEAHHLARVAGVVSNWQPLAIPGLSQADTVVHAPGQEQIAPPPPTETPSEGEPAPPESEEVAAEATQAAPQPAAPPVAPAIPIIQAPQDGAAPPASPPTRTPIQVLPSRQPGGPVVEWRPLTLPQQPDPASAPTERRPIWQPPAEEPPGEPEPVEPHPADEAAAPLEEADPPAEIASPYEDVIDYYPGYDEANGEPYTPAGPPDDDEYGAYVMQALPEDEIGLKDGEEETLPPDPRLLKPILDLSHIDERSRPHLVWTESPGADQYVLQEDADPAFSAPKEYRVKAGDTRWSPPRLLWRRSGRLFYRVRAEEDEAAGPWSEVLHVRIGRG